MRGSPYARTSTCGLAPNSIPLSFPGLVSLRVDEFDTVVCWQPPLPAVVEATDPRSNTVHINNLNFSLKRRMLGKKTVRRKYDTSTTSSVQERPYMTVNERDCHVFAHASHIQEIRIIIPARQWDFRCDEINVLRMAWNQITTAGRYTSQLPLSPPPSDGQSHIRQLPELHILGLIESDHTEICDLQDDIEKVYA